MRWQRRPRGTPGRCLSCTGTRTWPPAKGSPGRCDQAREHLPRWPLADAIRYVPAGTVRLLRASVAVIHQGGAMRLSFVTGIVVVSAITAITATNIANATASPGAKPNEHLRIMSTKAASRRLSVIATGAFTAGGYDKPGRKIDTIVLPGGTFTFKRVSTSFTGSANPKTCLITETQKGTFTLGSG